MIDTPCGLPSALERRAPVRVLPYALADGPHHMAADEVMLEAAAAGTASLRVYGWEPATLSLGYFQRHAERLADPQLAGMPWVRRATGGGAIVHDRDLTYAIAIPAAMRRGLKPEEWHCRIHRALSQVLRNRRIAAEVKGGDRSPQSELDFRCFAVPQPGDVLLEGRKIAGGAQRLRAGALLQHGSIQVRDLGEPREFAIELARTLEWDPLTTDWTPEETERIDELAARKYGQPAWNERR